LGTSPIVYQHLIGGFNLVITDSIITQWVIILIFAIAAMFLTRNLKRIPGKRQTVLETLIGTLNNIVTDTIGEEHKSLIPYVGALGTFLLIMNLTGLVGIPPATSDYSISLGMALTTFIMVQAYTISKIGGVHYFVGYLRPLPFMLPMNMLERVLLPVSLGLRLFGNMTAAAIIMGMVYTGLGSISPILTLGIPLPLHAYFDVFDGGIQMVVFTMLTMVNIKIIAEH